MPARNTAATGLDSAHAAAATIAAGVRWSCRQRSATSPNTTPREKVTRPVASIVTVRRQFQTALDGAPSGRGPGGRTGTRM